MGEKLSIGFWATKNQAGWLVNRQRGKRHDILCRFRVFGIYFYVTKIRMRPKQKRDEKSYDEYRNSIKYSYKRRLFEELGGVCQCCGRQLKYSRLQLHHVLPWHMYPEYEDDIRNMRLLCSDCHKALHDNPFAEVKEMELMAKRLGVDLGDRYAV